MAKPLTPQEVFELAGLLGQITQDQIDELIVELRREQPALYDYFQALRRLFPDASEYNDVVGLGYTVWQILKRSAAPPGRVTNEMLSRANQSYAAELQRLTAVQEDERRQATTQVVLSHPEPAMLAYLVAAIRQVGPSWSEHTLILANNALRVVLDALIASRGRKAGRRARRVSGGRA